MDPYDPLDSDFADGNLDRVRSQARRYMEARFGKDVWFRAPETFSNILEQWIWAVASGHLDYAEARITEIEQHLDQAGSR